MKEKDPEELSWSLRFILISISFFVFSWFTKLIGGSSVHASFFYIIAFIALGLAAIFFTTDLITAYVMRKENIPASTERDKFS
jgi:hypothetical protein